jgi:hypothetical protein
MRHWGWTSRRSLIQLHGATSCGSVVSPKQMRHVPASYLVADELVADELAGWVAAATQLLHRRASFLLRCALLNAEPHFAQFSISTSQELFKSSYSHTRALHSQDFTSRSPFWMRGRRTRYSCTEYSTIRSLHVCCTPGISGCTSLAGAAAAAVPRAAA